MASSFGPPGRQQVHQMQQRLQQQLHQQTHGGPTPPSASSFDVAGDLVLPKGLPPDVVNLLHQFKGRLPPEVTAALREVKEFSGFLGPNGQLQLPEFGHRGSGPRPDAERFTSFKVDGTMSASSTNGMHEATFAADGEPTTYWASEFDPKAPVTFTIKMQEPKPINVMRIDWEYAPSSFTIDTCKACGTDGSCECPDGTPSSDLLGQWGPLYSTTANPLPNTTVVSTKRPVADLIRITMNEPSPTWGQFGEHQLYGIRDVEVS